MKGEREKNTATYKKKETRDQNATNAADKLIEVKCALDSGEPNSV